MPEAEHPAYTTTARDVALCGNRYDTTNIDTACGNNWHVCSITEWNARFPPGVAPGGTLTSGGDDQATRCVGSVWQAYQPVNATVWAGNVCSSPYNPWNNGKYLYDTDGTTILQGSGSCCGWDSTFSVGSSSNMAVYCCRD